MKKRTERAAVAAIMMVVFMLLTGMTVMSQTKEDAHIDAEYYEVLEEEYLDEVRETLKQEGYSNCGLTLTFSRDAEGARNYTLSIYHKRLENLDETGKSEILSKIGGVSFVEPVEPQFLDA